MVSKQTSKSSHQKDKSLWQALSLFDSMHSSHKRSPTTLSCRKTAQHCRLGLYQDSDFAVDFEDSKSTSGGTLCIWRSRTFVPKSRMCKKQTSVTHSSTESEVISLDVGLRMDGVLAVDLWDVVIGVSHSSNYNTLPIPKNSANESWAKGAAGNCLRISNVKLRKEGNQNVDQLSCLHHVTTNANSSQCEAQLYILEDNEAVIKMIIKGRSPMMRHVSRTHRVALVWFDRINFVAKPRSVCLVSTNLNREQPSSFDPDASNVSWDGVAGICSEILKPN